MIKLNDPRITAYLLGELDPAEVEVIEQALRSSPMLAKNVEQMRQTIELLKLALPEENLNDSMEIASPASNENPAAIPTEKTPSTIGGFDKRWSLFLLEAVAVLAVGIGLYFLLQPGTEPILKPTEPAPSNLSTHTNESDIEIDPQVSFAPYNPSQQNPNAVNNTWEEYGLSTQQIEQLSQTPESSDISEMDAAVLFPSETISRAERSKANRELYAPDGWIAKIYGAAAVKADYSDKLIAENPIEFTNVKPTSHFGLCPQDASWQTFHRAITKSGSLPSPQSVRVEQFVNHFRYSLPQPGADDGAISVSVQIGRHPWAPGMLLAKIGLRAQPGEAGKTAARNALAEITFNPEQIKAYRLIGYEKLLTAGESSSSQSVQPTDVAANSEVVVLYELALSDSSGASPALSAEATPPLWFSIEVLYIDVQTETACSKTFKTHAQSDSILDQTDLDPDFQFAAAVALFAQILQKSDYLGTGTFDTVVLLLKDSVGDDSQRKEFANLVDKAIETTKKRER